MGPIYNLYEGITFKQFERMDISTNLLTLVTTTFSVATAFLLGNKFLPKPAAIVISACVGLYMFAYLAAQTSIAKKIAKFDINPKAAELVDEVLYNFMQHKKAL